MLLHSDVGGKPFLNQSHVFGTCRSISCLVSRTDCVESVSFLQAVISCVHTLMGVLHDHSAEQNFGEDQSARISDNADILSCVPDTVAHNPSGVDPTP